MRLKMSHRYHTPNRLPVIVLMITIPAFFVLPALAKTPRASLASPARVSVVCNASDTYTTRLTFTSDGFDLDAAAPGMPANSEDFLPENEGFVLHPDGVVLPAVSRFVLIPPTGGVQLAFTSLQSSTCRTTPPQSAQTGLFAEDDLAELHAAASSAPSSGFWPPQPAIVGEPAIMRGNRLVKVTYFPVQYDASRGECRLNSSLDISLSFGGVGVNEVSQPGRVKSSRSFNRMLRSWVINPPEPECDENESHGSVVYVMGNYNDVENAIQPLIEWRRRMGWTAEIIRLQGANDPAIVKEALQEAYDNWVTPPEAVVLCGDTDGNWPVGFFNTYEQGNFNYESDHPFVQLDGNDILPEASIGRLVFPNINQLNGIITKIIQYESDPYMGQGDVEPGWQIRAGVAATDSRSGKSTIDVCQWSAVLMQEHGYQRIERLFFTPQEPTVNPRVFINTTFDAGQSIFVYRGTANMNGYVAENIEQLRNGRMLPFVILATCNTGDYSEHMHSQWYWTERMAYLPNAGAIGAVGSAGPTSTQYNNMLLSGTLQTIFSEGIQAQGWALMGGKFNLYRNYAGFGDRMHPDNRNVENWLVTTYLYNLMGDPATELYTAIPKRLQVEHLERLVEGSSQLSVRVVEAAEEPQPLEGVRVCLYKPEVLQSVAFTNSEGNVNFTFDPLASAGGELLLTVTGTNLKPYLAAIPIDVDRNLIGFESYGVGEENAERIVVGNETEISVSIHNYGNVRPEGNGVAFLSTDDPRVDITAGVSAFEQGPDAGQSVDCQFRIVAIPRFHAGESIRFNLDLEIGESRFQSAFEVPVIAPKLELDTLIWSDGPPRRGAPTNFQIGLTNQGDLASGDLQARLISLTNTIAISRARSGFEPIAPDRNGVSGSEFQITPGQFHFGGSEAKLALILWDDPGFIDTIQFSFPVDTARDGEPFGPNKYGYICYDNSDEGWFGTPVFEWLELDPDRGGDGDLLELVDPREATDRSICIDLPFPFRFYGEEFDQITVCTNGWIAMGDQSTVTTGRNQNIPGGMVSGGMICPFWDDLITVQESAIYTQYFPEEHYFVVEWWQMEKLVPNNDGPTETFEVILYDAEFHPSLSGNGDILFQYRDAEDVRSCYESWDTPYATVGIGSPDRTDGLVYSYYGRLANGAAPIQDERAIRFTCMGNFKQAVIVGQIIDSETRDAIPGATVVCQYGFTGISDSAGNYSIDPVVADSLLLLTALAPGFNDSTRIDVHVAEGETLRVDFALLHPEILLSLDRFTAEIDSGDTIAIPFAMTNRGNGPLIWSGSPRLRGGGAGELGEIRQRIQAGAIVNDDRIQGVAFDGERFYIAGSNGDDVSLVYVFSREGEIIDFLPQYGSSRYGYKDLTFDGELLWGSGSDTIYAFTRDGRLVRSFRGIHNPNQAIAYDREHDWLWTSGVTTSIRAVTRMGQEIDPVLENMRLRIYGLSYWQDDPDGYKLYITAVLQTQPPIYALYKMNVETNDTMRVLELELNGGITGHHGGEIALNYDPTSVVFLSIANVPPDSGGDRLEVRHLAGRRDWMILDQSEGVVPAGERREINLTLDARNLMYAVYPGELRIRHNAVGFEVVLPIELTVAPNAAPSDPNDLLPDRLAISAIYPNPFNSRTEIACSIPQGESAHLTVYDMTGREIWTRELTKRLGGMVRVGWEAGDVPVGIYFCRLEGASRTVTRKLILLR
jgi:hypothetical protein